MVELLLFALAGGFIRRLIGWSGGWGGNNKPAWLVNLQDDVFDRAYLCVVYGLLVGGYAYLQGVSLLHGALLALAVPIPFLIGVGPKIGPYFDGEVIPNKGIGWIDWLVEKVVRPLLRKTRWDTAAESPEVVDGISMGIRGV